MITLPGSNDFVKFFLRTPLYVFMGDTMLITVTGRKTGKKYTTPVGFYREGDFLWVLTSHDRTWWRNVKNGADVEMRFRGKDVTGFAEAILDEEIEPRFQRKCEFNSSHFEVLFLVAFHFKGVDNFSCDF